MFWRYLARPILFRLPAERIHHLSMGAFNSLLAARAIAAQFRRHYAVNDARLHSRLFGIDFRNPVGLAAGFDKDAKWFPRLACLGFSHVEVGTITGQPQPGNPQPRLFRLPADQALVNRMGFNNGGSDAAAKRLATTSRFSPDDVLGVNIGKTKVVPVEQATDDYLFSFERLYLFADYFTINVSSPNTPGLRTLQNREPLIELLTRIAELNQTLAADHEIDPKPVLLKIAPDVTEGQLDDIVQIVRETSLSGIIATNTTLSRDGLTTPRAKVEAIGAGGLSGAPLSTRSREVVAQLYAQLEGQVPIIGVGGIMTPADAWKMILAGASMVQLYTGFVYGGPGIVRNVNRYLVQQLDRHGLETITQAVGQADRLADAAG